MIWRVVYRGAAGARESVEIEAETRQGVFEELKRLGINAISVDEGDGRGRRTTRQVASSARRSRMLLRGVVAGLIIVVGAVCAWWLIVSHTASATLVGVKEPASPKAEKRPAPAEKVAESPSPAPSVPQKTKGSAKETNAPQPKTYRDERGILRYEGGARVPNQRPTAEPVSVWAGKPKIFKHLAEESIADVLNMQIGQPVLGDFRYGEAFAKSFMESLDEPVEILDTDDEATVALKKDVEDTKRELKERMDAGEDVVKIMNDAMDEYRRLGEYRHELTVMRAKYMNEEGGHSDEDVRDFTEAANSMLKEKGLPPLALPVSLKRRLNRGGNK